MFLNMEFKLKNFHYNVSDKDLLDDLKRIADCLQISELSFRSYDSNGGLYNSGTIATRFGTWNSTLEKAELNLVQQRNVSKEDLFVNIEEVWIKLGRQTVYRDMQSFITKYTTHQYTSKF